MKSTLLPLIRHGLTVLAGYLIGRGYFDASGADEIVAGVMALITVGWSIAEKRGMKSDLPMPAILAGVLGLSILGTGCASTGGRTNVDDITPAVKVAATFGTFYAIRENPHWADEFEAAARALKVLEHAERIDFASIMAIVISLPVDELKSDDARLAITGATILLSSYGGKLVELDKLENLRPIATALREGIALGMAAPGE